MTNTYTHCNSEGCSSSGSGLHCGWGFVRGGAWHAASPPCSLGWRVWETEGQGEVFCAIQKSLYLVMTKALQ